MHACAYYDRRTNEIVDVLPKNLDGKLKSTIYEYWSQDINKKILINLSLFEELSITELKKLVGHSISTIHENVQKLESAKLIESEITYEGNKKKMLKPKVIFVTKNPRYKIAIQKFFQGLWINSKKTKTIIDFLQKNPDKYYTLEEISGKTRIPIDEVEILLSNWDSITTRTLSNFMRKKPFEKKVYYKGSKEP